MAFEKPITVVKAVDKILASRQVYPAVAFMFIRDVECQQLSEIYCIVYSPVEFF